MNTVVKGIELSNLFYLKNEEKAGSREIVHLHARMRDVTVRNRWVVDEDWAHHIWVDINDTDGVLDMNMGLSNACSWHNDPFELVEG